MIEYVATCNVSLRLMLKINTSVVYKIQVYFGNAVKLTKWQLKENYFNSQTLLLNLWKVLKVFETTQVKLMRKK